MREKHSSIYWRLFVVPAIAVLSLGLSSASAGAAPMYLSKIAKTQGMSRGKIVAILLLVVVILLAGLWAVMRNRNTVEKSD